MARISKITVNGLFGLFSHPISLNLNERLTIIHGANGLGKTVILRMVSALFDGAYMIFRRVPFESFVVDLEEGQSLVVTTVPASDERGQMSLPTGDVPRHVCVQLKQDGKVTINHLPGAQRIPRRQWHIDRIETLLPSLTRVGPDTWRDDRSGELLDLEDIIERFHDELPFANEASDEPKAIREVRRALNVRLIRTQRLDVDDESRRSSRGGPRSLPAVERNSNALTHHIRGILEEYAAVSQRLDRTFPLRLFQQKRTEEIPTIELRTRLSQLEERRRQLNELGFLESDTTLNQVPDEALDRRRDVLSIYVSDVEQKLAVFDDLARRVAELLRIVNERFKYKKLEVSRERGYVIRSSTGKELKPSDLSSGEQHELILVHELIFNTQKQSLILIDEPELSLHLEWQQRFLDDLQRISELSGFDVIIATHSADIIGSNWNLTVELRGPQETVTDA